MNFRVAAAIFGLLILAVVVGWCARPDIATSTVPTTAVHYQAMSTAQARYGAVAIAFHWVIAALIIANVAQPMELAHLPYRKGKSFEAYVGERGLKKRGKKKWRKYVFDVTERLSSALQADYVVIGGGNVDFLDTLPPNTRRGDNENAFKGGFRLWHEPALVV